MPPEKISPQEFAAKIKAKYPSYKDMDDMELVDKIVAKYPQYKDQIDFQKKNLGGKGSSPSDAPIQNTTGGRPSSSPLVQPRKSDEFLQTAIEVERKKNPALNQKIPKPDSQTVSGLSNALDWRTRLQESATALKSKLESPEELNAEVRLGKTVKPTMDLLVETDMRKREKAIEENRNEIFDNLVFDDFLFESDVTRPSSTNDYNRTAQINKLLENIGSMEFDADDIDKYDQMVKVIAESYDKAIENTKQRVVYGTSTAMGGAAVFMDTERSLELQKQKNDVMQKLLQPKALKLLGDKLPNADPKVIGKEYMKIFHPKEYDALAKVDNLQKESFDAKNIGYKAKLEHLKLLSESGADVSEQADKLVSDWGNLEYKEFPEIRKNKLRQLVMERLSNSGELGGIGDMAPTKALAELKKMALNPPDPRDLPLIQQMIDDLDVRFKPNMTIEEKDAIRTQWYNEAMQYKNQGIVDRYLDGLSNYSSDIAKGAEGIFKSTETQLLEKDKDALSTRRYLPNSFTAVGAEYIIDADDKSASYGQMILNPDSGKFNWGAVPYAAADGAAQLTIQLVAGELTGGLANAAMKGLGAAGVGSGVIGKAAMMNTKLFMPSFLMTFDQNAKQALEIFGAGDDAVFKRVVYTYVASALEGATEKIGNVYDQLGVSSLVRNEIKESLINNISRLSLKEIKKLSKPELQKKLTTLVRSSFGAVKGVVNTQGTEILEELANNIGEYMLSGILDQSTIEDRDLFQELRHTAQETFASMAFLGVKGAVGGGVSGYSNSSLAKGAMFEIATSPNEYRDAINKMKIEGQLSDAEAAEKLRLVNTIEKAKQNWDVASPLVRGIVGQDDKAFNNLAQQFVQARANEIALQREADKDDIGEAAKKSLQAQISKWQKVQEFVLNKKVYFDDMGNPSLTPVSVGNLVEVQAETEDGEKNVMFVPVDENGKVKPIETGGVSEAMPTKQVLAETDIVSALLSPLDEWEKKGYSIQVPLVSSLTNNSDIGFDGLEGLPKDNWHNDKIDEISKSNLSAQDKRKAFDEVISETNKRTAIAIAKMYVEGKKNGKYEYLVKTIDEIIANRQNAAKTTTEITAQTEEVAPAAEPAKRRLAGRLAKKPKDEEPPTPPAGAAPAAVEITASAIEVAPEAETKAQAAAAEQEVAKKLADLAKWRDEQNEIVRRLYQDNKSQPDAWVDAYNKVSEEYNRRIEEISQLAGQAYPTMPKAKKPVAQAAVEAEPQAEAVQLPARNDDFVRQYMTPEEQAALEGKTPEQKAEIIKAKRAELQAAAPATVEAAESRDLAAKKADEIKAIPTEDEFVAAMNKKFPNLNARYWDEAIVMAESNSNKNRIKDTQMGYAAKYREQEIKKINAKYDAELKALEAAAAAQKPQTVSETEKSIDKVSKNVEDTLGVSAEDANVLTLLKATKLLTDVEKKILWRQYKRGVMTAKEVAKYAIVDVADIQEGNIDKWARVALDKMKGKKIDAEDIDFEEISAAAPAAPAKEDAPKAAKAAEKNEPIAATPKVNQPTQLKSGESVVIGGKPSTMNIENAKVPVVFGEEAKNADAILEIFSAKNYHTLWVSIKRADRKGYSRFYISILSKDTQKAKEKAAIVAKKLAAGDFTGVAFTGSTEITGLTFKDYLESGRIKTIGVSDTFLSYEDLVEIQKQAIAEQPLRMGKYSQVLIKDLPSVDMGYVDWMVKNAYSGRLLEAANFLKNDPEYLAWKDEKIAKSQEVVTDESVNVLAKYEIEPNIKQDGTIQLKGKTYEWKDAIKDLGGRFDGEYWAISPEGYAKFTEKLGGLEDADVGRKGGLPTYVTNPRYGELRKQREQDPDRSGLPKPVGEYVATDTEALLRRGEAVGMPSFVIDEQVEDVAKMKFAYQDGKPMFLLASQPGSGKTFVLGAAIQELKRAGAKKIIYVTLRQELISQIKDDLSEFDIEGVEFITYPALREMKPSPSDVLVFDEAHAVKNVAEGTRQAEVAGKFISEAKFTIFSTATPFENPLQAQYAEATGVFENDFGGEGHKGFVLAFGGRLIQPKDKPEFIIYRRSATSNKDLKQAREFFRKRGMFTTRKTRLPQGMTDVRMAKTKADGKFASIYNSLVEAAAEFENSLTGYSRPWIINFQKRLLEASKVSAGIREAKSALERGRFPIIFVETKAERVIDIPDLIEKEEQYQYALRTRQRGEPKPQRKDFGVPPEGVVEVLSRFMEISGEKTIEIPSAEDAIRDAFGDKKVAIFTGSVTPKKAQENLDKWRSGEKPILVATMAKGGTGLSLHDKKGNHPTTQINVNLPWTATQVAQVAQRSARYGLKSRAEVIWLFTDDIQFDKTLASRVGGRMADMGAIVEGEISGTSANLENWDFNEASFAEQSNENAETPADFIDESAQQVSEPTPSVTAEPAAPAKEDAPKAAKAAEKNEPIAATPKVNQPIPKDKPLKDAESLAKDLDVAIRNSPLDTIEESDGRMRITGGGIEIKTAAKKSDKKENVTKPSKIGFLPKIITLFHLAKNEKDKKSILKKGFDITQTSIDSPIPGIYFSSEDWSTMDRFGRSKDNSLSVEIDNDGLLYFDSANDFAKYLKDNNLPFRGETLSKQQINTLKQKGVKGIVLREDFASQSRNELIVIDDSIIKGISESNKNTTKLPSSFSDTISISEAYIKSKKDGINPELVKAVEDALTTTQDATKSVSKDKPKPATEAKEGVEGGVQQGTEPVGEGNAEGAAAVLAKLNIAPFFSIKVNNKQEAESVIATQYYKDFKKLVDEVAKLFGVKIVSLTDGIGGYAGISEATTEFSVEGKWEDIVDFVAVMGALTPEVQEATIATRYVKSNSNEYNSDRIEFNVDNEGLTKDALAEAGFEKNGYTLLNGLVVLANPIKGQEYHDADFKEKLIDLINKLKEKGVKYGKQEKFPTQFEYIGRERRREILERIAGEALQREQGGAGFRELIANAQARNDQFIRERIEQEKQRGSDTGDNEQGQDEDRSGTNAKESVLEENKSAETQDFFTEVEEGKHRPSKPLEFVLPLTKSLKKIHDLWDRFKGYFDEHIETNIPAFREVQLRKIDAISKMLRNGGRMIDLGGSTGAFGKTVTSINPKIKSVNLDANEKMQERHNTVPVKGSDFARNAFLEGFDDVEAYTPKEKFDVVHESMLFQFIGWERGQFIDEIAENYLKEDGIVVLEEKLANNLFDANEQKKDQDFKLKYYDQKYIDKKKDEVLVGMKKNQASQLQLEVQLARRFKYVAQYWDGGNFKGYVASNSQAKVNEFLGLVGDTTSEFSSTEVAKEVEAAKQKELPQPKDGDRVSFKAKDGKSFIEYFMKNGKWHFIDSRGREQKEVESKQAEITEYWRKVSGKTLDQLAPQFEQDIADLLEEFPDATVDEVMEEVELSLPEMVANDELRAETLKRVQDIMNPKLTPLQKAVQAMQKSGAKAIPAKQKARTEKELANIMKSVFGLGDEQAAAAAKIGDLIIQRMAELNGISVAEQYQRIAYAQAAATDPNTGNILYQGGGALADVESTEKELNNTLEFKGDYERHFEYVKIEDIEKYKEHDRSVEKKWGKLDDTLDKLIEEIEKDGIKEPISLQVDPSGYALVVEGNTRLAAAKKLGIKYIPIRVTSGSFGSINSAKAKKIDRKRDIGEMKVFYPSVNLINYDRSAAYYGFDSINIPKQKSVSEAYHAAKKDGTNPALVKAVEDILAQPQGGNILYQGDDNVKISKDMPISEAAAFMEYLKANPQEAKKLTNREANILSKKYDLYFKELNKKSDDDFRQNIEQIKNLPAEEKTDLLNRNNQLRQKNMRDKFAYEKILDDAGLDRFNLGGDTNSPQTFHFTSAETAISILEGDSIFGEQQEDEGFGGISTTTNEEFNDPFFATVKQYGVNFQEISGFENSAVNIVLDLDKLKQDGYTAIKGRESIGTFAGEEEVRIIKKEEGQKAIDVSETKIENASKYIKEIVIERSKLSKEQFDEITSLAKSKGIKYSEKAAAQPQGGNTLFQSGLGAQGAIVMQNASAIVYAMTNPNVTTPLHELSHGYFDALIDAGMNGNAQADADVRTVMKEAGVGLANPIDLRSDPDAYRKVQEYFARGFEKLLRDGVAPRPELQDLFNRFRDWLMDIYRTLKGSPIDIQLNDAMRDVYGRMLSPEIVAQDFPQTIDTATLKGSAELFDKMAALEGAADLRKIGEMAKLENQYGKEKVALAKIIQSNFDAITDQLNKAGLVKKDCK